MKSERDLWEGFKKGEKGALIKIYDLYIDPLCRYGKKFSANDELIKDTVQDLFLDLIRTRSNLGKTDQIYFYLLKAFRRRLFQSLSESRNLNLSEGEFETLEAHIIYSVEDEWVQKEHLSKKEQMIRLGLEKLSPKQREIIYYRFTCDFEYEQICELMSIKYDSARKMIFRAMQTLREHITETSITLFTVHTQGIKSFIKKT